MKKGFYAVLGITAFIMLSGNSESMLGWFLWESFWLAVGALALVGFESA